MRIQEHALECVSIVGTLALACEVNVWQNDPRTERVALSGASSPSVATGSIHENEE